MGKSSKPPKPPDPGTTAAAQSTINRDTAITNAIMNMTNQVTPDGSLTYSRTGEEDVYISPVYDDKGRLVPGTGTTIKLPRFTSTQSLSPEQQAIKQQQDLASLNLATLGNNLSGTLGQQLTGNFTLGNEAVEGRLFDLGRRRLDPMFAEQDESLRTRLANQGIRAGSDAYDAEMRRFGENRNDAYNELLLRGRGQAVQEQLTEDNQRINQISALMGGGQVSQPNFINTPGTSLANVDYAGLVGDNYRARLANWQAQQAQQQAMMGGLFGAIGAGLSAFSDERLKENVEKVGKTGDGQNIYSYNYKGDPTPQMGLIAQEVKEKHPEAVHTHRSGFMMVDYGKALARSGQKKRRA